MPRIGEIEERGKKGLDISGLPWLKKGINSDLIKGGIYLLAGEPGIGKTSLAIQILGDLARKGVKVLYIPTEQSLADIKRVTTRILGSVPKTARSAISENFYIDTIDDLSM